MSYCSARTTPIPTLFDLERLWSQIPENRLQASVSRKMLAAKREEARKEKIALRQRQSIAMKQGASAINPQQMADTTADDGDDAEGEGHTGLWSWIRSIFVRQRPTIQKSKEETKDAKQQLQPRPPHPFAVLKAGRKGVIIAVVDSGNIGFYRFAEGVFGEMEIM